MEEKQKKRKRVKQGDGPSWTAVTAGLSTLESALDTSRSPTPARRKIEKQSLEEEYAAGVSPMEGEEEKNCWLKGGGEMGKLVRSMDWSKTPLGPLNSWPQSLRTTVSLVLASNSPISLAWGPEGIQIYNDGYWPICGAKHPQAMGQRFRECWAAPWPVIGDAFEEALKGKTRYLENQRMFLDRYGSLEETFFTFSFSPIQDESGGVGGLFHPVTEVTSKLLSERRTNCLRDLSSKTGKETTCTEVIKQAAQVLADYALDIPFALIYLIDDKCTEARLIDRVGITEERVCSEMVPLVSSSSNETEGVMMERHSPSIDTSCSANPSSLWAPTFCQAVSECHAVEVNINELFGEVYCDYPDPMGKTSVIPLAPAGCTKPVAIFVAGMSTRLRLDQNYRTHIDLVAASITAGLSNARAHEESKARADALAAIDRAKTEFFSNVSHEFRTPLTLMLAPLEDSLSDTINPLSSAQRIRQELIHRNAVRLLKLVNALLDFSRVEANRMQRRYLPTDLERLTRNLTSMFVPAMEKAGLIYEVEMETLDEPVYVDHDMWEKIVLNLISNAFKFTLVGKIGVSLVKSEDAKSIELTVRDTGVGIPEHELDHLFERFHRVQGTQGRSFEGSGIGLALTQELVKAHGGTIEVKSQFGTGTTIRVRIPLGKDHLPKESVVQLDSTVCVGDNQRSSLGEHFFQEVLSWMPDLDNIPGTPSTEESSEISADGMPGAKILLVDDNTDMRRYIKSLMKPFWEVEECRDGLFALEAIRAGKKPDLILTDVMMPRMDGFQLLAALRSDPNTNSIPVIMLSARAGEEAKVEGLQAGADDYLVKPFSKKELQARVKSQLELGRLRSTLEQKVLERTEQLSTVNESLLSEIGMRKQAQRSLRQSEGAYRALVSVVPVGIFRINRVTDTIQYANDYLRSLVGRTIELDGKSWQALVHPADRDRVIQERNAVPEGTIFTTEFRLSIAAAESSPPTVILQISALDPDSSSDLTGAVMDITERKLLEERRLRDAKESERQARLRAEESERYQQRLKDFIDVTCHEIRNPLNGILGCIELMQDGMQTAMGTSDLDQLQTIISETSRGIESIRACVEHQTTITNDVLDLTKLESDCIFCTNSSFDITHMVGQVANMFALAIERKHLTFVLKCPEVPIFVWGDEQKLQRVMINLLSNSLKYTSSGCITMSLEELSSDKDFTTLSFSVEDTGVGMTSEEVGGLFDRYSKRKISYQYGSSGLGLLISQRLLQLMGSKIEVESTKSKGSKFGCQLRLEKRSPSGARPTTHAATPSSELSQPIIATRGGRGKKILIVEDNPINQKVLRMTLEKDGYNCDAAYDGRQCLEKVATEIYDLIVMDIEMPVMNGFEATQAIRSQERHAGTAPVPIVCLTGNARDEYRKQALEIGMDDFIAKPFKREPLLRKIGSWCGVGVVS